VHSELRSFAVQSDVLEEGSRKENEMILTARAMGASERSTQYIGADRGRDAGSQGESTTDDWEQR
jgi:hypothetical protein